MKKLPNAVVLPDGNYKAIENTTSANDTGKTYTDKKGNVFPVFQASKGKLFIVKTSKKTGKEYRIYLYT